MKQDEHIPIISIYILIRAAWADRLSGNERTWELLMKLENELAKQAAIGYN